MAEIIDKKYPEVQLNAQGRFVIPAEMRRRLNFKAGDKLVVRVSKDQLVVEKADAVKRRLKRRFQDIPRTVDMASEVLQGRRQEVSKTKT